MGEGKYKPTNNNKYTKQYSYWKHMLRRCYSNEYLTKEPTYLDKIVCKEWHNFQTFAKWFDENYYEIEGQRMQLDKDILNKGNKIYSPQTCIFVPQRINNLFVKRDSKRGRYPIGVYLDKYTNRFKAHISIEHEDGSKRQKHLGRFNTPEEAFEVYKIEKEKYIKEVAEEYKDKIPKELYDAMYKYEVEITD